MNYQRAVSAGQINEQEQLRAATILQNAQRVLKAHQSHQSVCDVFIPAIGSI